MKVKRLLITFFIASLLFLPSAMSFGRGAAEGSKEKVSIAGTHLNFIQPEFDDARILHKTAFPKAAKDLGLTYKVSWYSFDGVREKLIVDFRGGASVWDVVIIDPKQLAEYVSMGLVVPIDKLRKDYPGLIDDKLLGLDKTIPYKIKEMTYKDKLYALPYTVAQVGYVYRTDLFDDPGEKADFLKEYGYELKPADTYKQFFDISKFFTRKKGEKLAGKELEEDFYGTVHSNKPGGFLWHDYVSYMVAFGARLYNPDTMMPEWNSKENIATGKYYVKLGKYQPPGHTAMTSGEATSWFAQGKVAHQIEFLHRVDNIAEDEKSLIRGKVGYSVLPKREGNPVGLKRPALQSGGGFGIYALSKNKAAAYKLLELALSPEYFKLYYTIGTAIIPTRLEFFDDPKQIEAHPHWSVVKKYATSKDLLSWLHPQLPEYAELYLIASDSISKALAGEPVEEAYNDDQERMVDAMKRAEYIK